MKSLVREKEKAIKLRKKGCSYKEILREVPVAKSSLSLWFRGLPLTENEKSALKARKDANISRGRIRAAAANRSNRLLREQELLAQAKTEFQLYQFDPLFHTGIALYWAEGAKRSTMFHFTNSDISMVQTMLTWLEKFTSYSRKGLGYRLYIHKSYAGEHCEELWTKALGVSPSNFKKTVCKPGSSFVKKRPQYMGCIRVEVPKSKHLLSKMKFWQRMLVEYYQKQ